jgi:hypothetical protein
VCQLRNASKCKRIPNIVVGLGQGTGVTPAVDVTRSQDVVEGVTLAAHLHGQIQADSDGENE